MHIYDLIQGLIIGSTLIIAIGPQNLFVINQGLKKTFVFTVVLFCSLSDSILIIIGINLSSVIVDINPNTIIILKILGGIWLVYYGLNKIRYVNKIRNLQNINTIESNAMVSKAKFGHDEVGGDSSYTIFWIWMPEISGKDYNAIADYFCPVFKVNGLGGITVSIKKNATYNTLGRAYCR